MRYLTLAEVLDLHRRVIEQSGGADGVRALGGIESAVAQPQMTFDGVELYPTIGPKATALCFSLVKNHPFVDGNKRIGHADGWFRRCLSRGHHSSRDWTDAALPDLASFGELHAAVVVAGLRHGERNPRGLGEGTPRAGAARDLVIADYLSAVER